MRASTTYKAIVLVAGTLLLQAGPAWALGLREAYDAALQHDPAYRAAFYERENGKENATIGRAGLLPNLQFSYSASKNVADSTLVTARGDDISHPKYNSRNATLQLRQPLFNLDAWARYRQGMAQSAYSAAVFDAQQQEAVLRVTGAYVDALFADEQLALARAQRDTLVEQRKVNDRMFAQGEGTRTDMLETESKLDVTEAQVLEAVDNQVNARTVLAGIVGQEITGLDGLSPGFRILPMREGGLDAWKQLALENNPDMRAQREAIEAASQEVNKSRAGHAPRLDFVASYGQSAADTVNTNNQSSKVRSIGVQLVVPLYAGGAVNASSRQAVAALEKARADYDGKADKALAELRKQYNAVVSSVAKIRALEKAVESGKLLTTATEQSIKGGVRINLDLLNAQQQLYGTRRDLAQARYNYLVSTLRLRAAAGVLGGEDVNQIAAYFR